MIYDNISKEFAEFLHSHGFIYGNRKFKLFTFSRLEGRFNITGKGKIVFIPPFHLIVASPIERFLRELSEGLLRNDNLDILRQHIIVENVSVFSPMEDVDFGEEITIKMLSPVVAYKTNGQETARKTLYFSPWDEWFSDLIRSNLRKKYQLITGKKLDDVDFRVSPIGPKDKKYCKIIRYKGTVIKGWLGIYKIRGDRRLMKIAYDTGLGSKNSQGFGCFEVIGGLKR